MLLHIDPYSIPIYADENESLSLGEMHRNKPHHLKINTICNYAYRSYPINVRAIYIPTLNGCMQYKGSLKDATERYNFMHDRTQAARMMGVIEDDLIFIHNPSE